MARIPIEGDDARIDLVQGGNYDETITFYDGPGETNPHDFTGESAELRFAKDAKSNPFLVLSSEGVSDPLTDGDGLYLDADGNLRIYITDETLAALDEENTANFIPAGGCDDDAPFRALNTLLFTDADDVTTIEMIGPVSFTPIVQPAP